MNLLYYRLIKLVRPSMPQPLIPPVMPLMSISAQPVRPPQQPAGQPSQLMRSGFGKLVFSQTGIIFFISCVSFLRFNGNGSEISRNQCSFSSNPGKPFINVYKFSNNYLKFVFFLLKSPQLLLVQRLNQQLKPHNNLNNKPKYRMSIKKKY